MQNNGAYLNRIICGDANEILRKLKPNSVDIVLTDPPYFLDKLDESWDTRTVHSEKYMHTVTSLPAGMKFTREQGVELYRWFKKISKRIYRVLKPGGFFFSFSSPRLYHRMACAMDDAGFEMRDAFAWIYTQNQPKGMTVNHFIDRKNIREEERARLKAMLDGWKTPQIKSCFEPIAMGQKPVLSTYLENMLAFDVGMLNTKVRIGEDMYPANVMTLDDMGEMISRNFLVAKPDRGEKGGFNTHKTVKPVEICEYIIKLAAFSKNAVVLDPFIGSGTTAVACKKLGVSYIGIDLNDAYCKIARRRIEQAQSGKL